MSAIEAVSRNVKTMADGTLRLTVDISPVHAQDAFSMFGMPDVPLALARLNIQASQAIAQQETISADKPKGGFLSQWLALRCTEPAFWEFVYTKSHCPHLISNFEECDAEVKLFLGIQSKKELENDKEAESRFHKMIRLPYAEWLMGKR
jgi:hypothetical protein